MKFKRSMTYQMMHITCKPRFRATYVYPLIRIQSKAFWHTPDNASKSVAFVEKDDDHETKIRVIRYIREDKAALTADSYISMLLMPPFDSVSFCCASQLTVGR